MGKQRVPIHGVLINGYREGFCSKHNVNKLIKLKLKYVKHDA